jgi:hypothetical protein
MTGFIAVKYKRDEIKEHLNNRKMLLAGQINSHQLRMALAAAVKIFGNGIGCHCLYGDKTKNGPTRRLCNGLENITLHI